jgi:hypothetical protein
MPRHGSEIWVSDKILRTFGSSTGDILKTTAGIYKTGLNK